MTFLDIIEKKKNSLSLSQNECDFFISSVVNNSVPDYQISALLMAIYLNGLVIDEMIWITEAIVKYSEKVDVNATNKLGIIIDKHSSGGIGDKVSLLISPILEAIGYDIVKLSGRGLSFTGGTIDKLETIGICYEYDPNTCQQFLDKTHMLIMLQSEKLTPADKKLYALRDTTGTVNSLPLIAISIISKKLIVKSDYIFLDIKIGQGAFCKTVEEGEIVSEYMMQIAKHFNRKLLIHLTKMDQPLGRAIGNAVEIKETLDFLSNKFQSPSLKRFIEEFCCDILIDTKVANTYSEAQDIFNDVLTNNKAYEAFMNFVKFFSSDYAKVINNQYFTPKNSVQIYAQKSGYLSFSKVDEVGRIANQLGAGRLTKDDLIDYNAGIELNFEPFSYVNEGDHIATLYSDKAIKEELVNRFHNLLNYQANEMASNSLIIKKFQ